MRMKEKKRKEKCTHTQTHYKLKDEKKKRLILTVANKLTVKKDQLMSMLLQKEKKLIDTMCFKKERKKVDIQRTEIASN